MLRGLLLPLCLLASLLHAEGDREESALDISGLEVREPIPGRMMSSAYLTITNTSAEDRTLLSASADWAGLIEIHTHIHEDGVMRMRQLPSLIIPAGESRVFEPGGLHLMLFRLSLPLPETLTMTLCFDDDECLIAEADLMVP